MMKTIQKLRLFSFSTPLLFSPPTAAIFLHHFSSSIQTEFQDTASSSPSIALTPEEIKEINLLIPRLCSKNHFKEATGLITTALLTNPPLNSLPLSIFIQRLTEEPDLTHSMYFLNKMKYTPKVHSFLNHVTRTLVDSYFQNGQPKWALKIFHWVSRSDFLSEGVIDVGFYGLLIKGFCKYNMVLEALMVLRAIASENLVVGDDVRFCVYRCLLREARIRDAQELNKVLESEDNDKLMEILDHMISNWVE